MIRNILRFIVVLGIVCVLTGGGVAVLYAVFKGDLERRENEAKESALLQSAPEGATVDIQHPLAGQPYAPDAVYAAKQSDGKVVAYVAAGEAGGYSSTVRVVICVGADDLGIQRVIVASQAETPGLGTQVAETKSSYTLWDKVFGAKQSEQLFNPFIDQFEGKKPAEFPQIHAITAATITSNATKKAAEGAYQRIQKAVESKP
jgi:RnfABCDGE-type electron transport complex G subunit